MKRIANNLFLIATFFFAQTFCMYHDYGSDQEESQSMPIEQDQQTDLFDALAINHNKF